MSTINRRAFSALFGGAAAAWPLAVRAQQPRMPVIGFLRSTTITDATHLLAAFRQGLKEMGFVDGQNVAIEVRAAEGQFDRLQPLVAELIRMPVALIVGNVAAAVAAKSATTTVPIVFAIGADPVREGLVASFNRPGGNITGVHFFGSVLGAKRLELLRQLVPKAATIGVLVNTKLQPDSEGELRDVQAAAQAIGQQLLVLDVTSEPDIEQAYATFVQRGVAAVFTGSGPFMNSRRGRLVALAKHHTLPAIYAWREAVLAGGLISYGTSQSDAYRQAGIYAGRILNGEKPGDLPVMQSTKFEFVINLKTAKALDLEVPDRLLVAADEVIE
jgi:putative ABC transport system substrate-binding protein